MLLTLEWGFCGIFFVDVGVDLELGRAADVGAGAGGAVGDDATAVDGTDLGGLEPRTYGLQNRCSSQLS